MTTTTTHRLPTRERIPEVLELLLAGTNVILASDMTYKSLYAAMLAAHSGMNEERLVEVFHGSRITDAEREVFERADSELRSLPIYPLFPRDLGDDPDAAIAECLSNLADVGKVAVVIR